MVSLLSISGLSYFENPRNTRNQCEESRKVWGQYIHEHGNVIQNICKKSEEAKRKVKKTHQTGQTPRDTLLLHHAHLHFLASESSFVLEMKTKSSSAGHIPKHLFAILLKKYISTLSSTQRGFFHTCQFHLQDKNHTSHTPRLHTGTASIESICWRLTF